MGGCSLRMGGGRSSSKGGEGGLHQLDVVEGRTMNFHIGKFKIEHDHMMSEFQWTWNELWLTNCRSQNCTRYMNNNND